MGRILLVMLLATAIFAAPPNPVAWKIDGVPSKAVKPGAKFTVRLVGNIEPGWHVYSMKPLPEGPIAMRIWTTGPFEIDGGVRAPKPLTVQDPAFNMRVEFYQGEMAFGMPLKVSPDASPGAQTLTISVSYQSCNDSMCLPPRTVQVTAHLEVKK